MGGDPNAKVSGVPVPPLHSRVPLCELRRANLRFNIAGPSARGPSSALQQCGKRKASTPTPGRLTSFPFTLLVLGHGLAQHPPEENLQGLLSLRASLESRAVPALASSEGEGRGPCPGLQRKPLECRPAPLALGDPALRVCQAWQFLKFFEMF